MAGQILHISVFDRPGEVSEEMFREDCGRLPEWRRRKALSYRFLRDRVLCAKAWLLLKENLLEHWGLDEDPVFGFGINGKPFLPDHPEIHFNLSHCPEGVLCVTSDRPVGCDIEGIADDLDPALLRKCFSEREISIILGAVSPEIGFTKMWTVKEAVLKLSGEGLTDDLPSLLTYIDGPFLSGDLSSVFSVSCRGEQLRVQTTISPDRRSVLSIASSAHC